MTLYSQNHFSGLSLNPKIVFIFAILFLLLGEVLVDVSTAEQQPIPNFKGVPTSNTHTDDISISTVSILLPHDPKVQFVVDAFNGCFKWYVLSLCFPLRD